jgi:hypothetical protein
LLQVLFDDLSQKIAGFEIRGGGDGFGFGHGLILGVTTP